MPQEWISPADLDALGRDLHVIETRAGWLDTLATRWPPSSGTRAGARHNQPGPQSPARDHILDIKADIAVVVCGWAANLTEAHPQAGPSPRSCSAAAGWLHHRLPLLAQCDWAPDAADEIRTAARRLADTIDPPPPAPPAGALVTAAQAAAWLTATGRPTTAAQVRQWAARGHITPTGHDHHGHPTYHLDHL